MIVHSWWIYNPDANSFPVHKFFFGSSSGSGSISASPSKAPILKFLNDLVVTSFNHLDAGMGKYLCCNATLAALTLKTFLTHFSQSRPILWLFRPQNGPCILQQHLQQFARNKVLTHKLEWQKTNKATVSTFVKQLDILLVSLTSWIF